MKIKIQETEIDTADDSIIWDPMMQEVVNYVKANPSSKNISTRRIMREFFDKIPFWLISVLVYVIGGGLLVWLLFNV